MISEDEIRALIMGEKLYLNPLFYVRAETDFFFNHIGDSSLFFSFIEQPSKLEFFKINLYFKHNSDKSEHLINLIKFKSYFKDDLSKFAFSMLPKKLKDKMENYIVFLCTDKLKDSIFFLREKLQIFA